MAGLSPGILVKAYATAPALATATQSAAATPVLTSIGAQNGGLGVASDAQWTRLDTDDASPAQLWERCHDLHRGAAFGLADGAVAFAEPDLPQVWRWTSPDQQALALAQSCDTPLPPAAGYPAPPSFDWFREAGYSDFGTPNPATGTGARIAHFDTGFDPNHSTLPQHLDTARQRNFVDANTPNSAVDTASGLVAQHGHGTATLALLASAGYGGAPGAQVIPFRVANSVVLFSNSTIAAAFDEVHRLTVSGEAPVDVVTMSMGGLASQLWADAVNALYMAGVFIVTAAGNNYGNLPTRFIVYPARFKRVIAACGVMSDGRPYADLDGKLMAGNYGPADKMKTALAASTPNVPWARFGCPLAVDQMGGGTSSATPQVAAAAAIYIARHRTVLPAGWQKVEAVRAALFGSVHGGAQDPAHFGVGRLDSGVALGAAVQPAADLVQTSPDDASWGLIRLLIGLGVAAQTSDPAQAQLELEALQITQRFRAETIIDESAPPEAWSASARALLAQKIADQPEASPTLKAALAGAARSPLPNVQPVAPEIHAPTAPANPIAAQHLRLALAPPTPKPTRRRLRAYAYDPVASIDLDRYLENEAALDVRWEEHLAPGPVGEYLEVVDVDPASGCAYAPVDLNDRNLIAADGLPPSEGDPQFHQQMAYAVAMKTIEHFELALGRRALWAPAPFKNGKATGANHGFVRRLRIYPHAIRSENAFYSPERSALLFGYFNARDRATGQVLPGGLVHACLSHDIIAHETTHALLDGLHRYYREASNTDALSFHEGFADIVALFQHFTIPEALRTEVAKTQGDVDRESLLGQLAMQFGEATGHRAALRSYIGQTDPATGAWTLRKPQPTDYAQATEVHDRGAVLVAAVFEVFLVLYRARSRDLLRLATNGTGILPQGDIPADLVDRLTGEATTVAATLLQMCIRALDYCPPVDLTFGDYLRALITADQDVSSDARREYRIALISAFGARGIYPDGLTSLSPTSAAWEPPAIPLGALSTILNDLDRSSKIQWSLYDDRLAIFEGSRSAAAALHDQLMNPHFRPSELEALGLIRVEKGTMLPATLDGVSGQYHAFEVHSVRPARRIDARGQARTHLVVEITQRWSTQIPSGGWEDVRGGCTLLFDMEERQVCYLVRKRLASPNRIRAQLSFKAAAGLSTLRGAYWTDERAHGEPFAVLHQSR